MPSLWLDLWPCRRRPGQRNKAGNSIRGYPIFMEMSCMRSFQVWVRGVSGGVDWTIIVQSIFRRKPSSIRWRLSSLLVCCGAMRRASLCLRRERDSSPVLQPFCVFLCITTHFIVNEWVDALFASLFWRVSLCVSMQDLVVFSSWCNFLRVKMHCVQKPCTWTFPKTLYKVGTR